MSASRPTLPPRLLPLLYLGFAHVALATAFAAVALDPRGVAGFFYHPRMLAIVHLVTPGWITASILGALYLVGPIALRTELRRCCRPVSGASSSRFFWAPAERGAGQS